MQASAAAAAESAVAAQAQVTRVRLFSLELFISCCIVVGPFLPAELTPEKELQSLESMAFRKVRARSAHAVSVVAFPEIVPVRFLDLLLRCHRPA